MADWKRFDPVYFNGRRICNFSKLKPKDRSKVRKQVQKRSAATPLDEDRSRDEMLSVVEVDLELDDDLGEEHHSYTCHDQGVFQQIPAENSGTEISQEQPSIIQEYVLLLCRFEAVTMLDYKRFCLPKFSSSQHKLLVGWVFLFN